MCSVKCLLVILILTAFILTAGIFTLIGIEISKTTPESEPTGEPIVEAFDFQNAPRRVAGVLETLSDNNMWCPGPSITDCEPNWKYQGVDYCADEMDNPVSKRTDGDYTEREFLEKSGSEGITLFGDSRCNFNTRDNNCLDFPKWDGNTHYCFSSKGTLKYLDNDFAEQSMEWGNRVVMYEGINFGHGVFFDNNLAMSISPHLMERWYLSFFKGLQMYRKLDVISWGVSPIGTYQCSGHFLFLHYGVGDVTDGTGHTIPEPYKTCTMNRWCVSLRVMFLKGPIELKSGSGGADNQYRATPKYICFSQPSRSKLFSIEAFGSWGNEGCTISKKNAFRDGDWNCDMNQATTLADGNRDCNSCGTCVEDTDKGRKCSVVADENMVGLEKACQQTQGCHYWDTPSIVTGDTDRTYPNDGCDSQHGSARIREFFTERFHKDNKDTNAGNKTTEYPHNWDTEMISIKGPSQFTGKLSTPAVPSDVKQIKYITAPVSIPPTTNNMELFSSDCRTCNLMKKIADVSNRTHVTQNFNCSCTSKIGFGICMIICLLPGGDGSDAVDSVARQRINDMDDRLTGEINEVSSRTTKLESNYDHYVVPAITNIEGELRTEQTEIIELNRKEKATNMRIDQEVKDRLFQEFDILKESRMRQEYGTYQHDYSRLAEEAQKYIHGFSLVKTADDCYRLVKTSSDEYEIPTQFPSFAPLPTLEIVTEIYTPAPELSTSSGWSTGAIVGTTIGAIAVIVIIIIIIYCLVKGKSGMGAIV